MLKIKGQKKDPTVPPLSVSALFTLSCFHHNNDIVVDQKDLTFTRREMKRDRKIFAKVLLELGVKSGDVITFATSAPVYENIVAFLAANQIGAIVVYFDESTPRETLIHYLEEFKSPVLITRERLSKAKGYKKDVKTLKHVIDFDGSSDLKGAFVGKTNILKIAERHKGRIPHNTFSANKTALITFTSGSTSGPKPLSFTNKALVAGAIYNKAASGVKMWDKNIHSWMQFVRLNYPYGFWVSTMSPILGGGKVILTPDLKPDNFDFYFGKNPDTIFGVPILVDYLEKYLSPKVNLDQVKMFASGGERLDPSVAKQAISLLKKHGAKKAVLCNGYGLGEVLGLISTSVGQTYHPGTVGKIPAGVHVMVLDPDTGEEIGFNKPGLIYVNGKHMLTEYCNRPDINEEKFMTVRGRRYLATGDIGAVSPTGFVTLIGRSIFFLNNIPAKVYYEYVRAAVMRSDLVKTCYVVKGPDAKYEQAAYAFVVVKDGVPKNNTTRRAIAKTCAEPYRVGHDQILLRAHEIPRKIIFLDELPLTPANKTDFRKLEKMAREM